MSTRFGVNVNSAIISYMRTRAVLSLLLAFALAFVPLAPAIAVYASAGSDLTAHTGHDRSAANVAHGHDMMPMQADAPASDCADHADCKGSCCAHCVSVPLPFTRTAIEAKPIQAGERGEMRLTFNSDTPSRPPRIIL